MTMYQMYEHGRVLVCQIKARSHKEAASLLFASNTKARFVSVGRRGTSPEQHYSRASV